MGRVDYPRVIIRALAVTPQISRFGPVEPSLEMTGEDDCTMPLCFNAKRGTHPWIPPAKLTRKLWPFICEPAPQRSLSFSW